MEEAWSETQWSFVMVVRLSSDWARAHVLPWFPFHSSLAARPLTPPTASTVADPVGVSATILAVVGIGRSVACVVARAQYRARRHAWVETVLCAEARVRSRARRHATGRSDSHSPYPNPNSMNSYIFRPLTKLWPSPRGPTGDLGLQSPPPERCAPWCRRCPPWCPGPAGIRFRHSAVGPL